MDVSTAPQKHPDPNPIPPLPQTADRSSRSDVSKNSGAPATAPALAPERRMTPLLYGLVMGLAAGISVALTCTVVLAVAGVLGSGTSFLTQATVVLSIATAIYVGVRAWIKQKSPRPLSRGRCPDCGRELLPEDDRCSLCGRAVAGD